MAISTKAKNIWKRLNGFYGARFADSYGPTPPPDWCDSIDRCDSEQLSAAMERVRRDHITFPPTLGEFEAAMKKPAYRGYKKSPGEILTEWIVATKRLTAVQLSKPWKWLHDSDGVLVGVVIASDGDSTGHRVMMMDMALEDVA